MRRARLEASGGFGAPGEHATIPIHPDITPKELQYRLPSVLNREHLLPSYVRFVANLEENRHDDGETEIDTIKIYLVEHVVMQRSQWKAGLQPYDPETYR